MKILIVSATPFEIAPLINHLDNHWDKKSFFTYKREEIEVTTLVTGVGIFHTTLSLSSIPDLSDFTHVFNVGIAGTFDQQLSLGATVEITKDIFGDVGVEESDGSFTDVFDLELQDKDLFPYTNGWITNHDQKLDLGLIKVSAITVNKVHGMTSSIDHIKEKYKANLETMEGAAFMYICKSRRLSFYQVRAISNVVESRNRESWKIELAIDNLNDWLINYLSNFN